MVLKLLKYPVLPSQKDGDVADAAEAADDVQIQVTVPTNTAVGDVISVTVTLPDNSQIVVEEQVPSDWNGTDTVEVTAPALYDGDYTAVATVTDSNGNVSPASNEDAFTIDRSEVVTPDAPVIAISEAQPDGLVNEAESSDGVQVQVTVPEDTVAGDVITLTVSQPNGNDFIVSETVPADWNGEDAIEISVPAFFEGDYSATATITNADGQESAVSNNADFNLDKTAPGEDSADTITEPNIAIAEAAGDGIVDASEVLDGVQVQVTVPESTQVGDTVTLSVITPDGSSVSVETSVPTNWNGAEEIEVTIPADQVTLEGEYQTSATVTDAAGNVSTFPTLRISFSMMALKSLKCPVLT